MSTPAAPIVAVEAPTGTTGSDGLAVFTFGADITSDSAIVVDRLVQGVGIDYTVTGTRQVTFLAGNIPVGGAQIWLLPGGVSSAVGTSLPSWDTVANLISDAAIELGLISAPIDNPFASSDPNMLRLIRYLKSGGRKLAKHRNWTHLQKEFTFATVAGQAAYGLPSDFRSMVPQTGWDRTTQFPLGGPVDGEYWQFRQAVPFGASVYNYLRLWQGQIFLAPTPTGADTIAFEYQSTSWVMPSGQTAPTSSTPTAASDVIAFEPDLIVAMLQARFRQKTGFDYSTDDEEYKTALYAAEREDSPARTIYIGGKRGSSIRRLDRWNIPDTGAGH